MFLSVNIFEKRLMKRKWAENFQKKTQLELVRSYMRPVFHDRHVKVFQYNLDTNTRSYLGFLEKINMPVTISTQGIKLKICVAI